MGELADAYADPALGAFDLEFYDGDGRVRRSLGDSWNVRFEQIPPVRPFRWPKGGKSFAGWYNAATMRDHVGYESWLERDRLILLDADAGVTQISAPPSESASPRTPPSPRSSTPLRRQAASPARRCNRRSRNSWMPIPHTRGGTLAAPDHPPQGSAPPGLPPLRWRRRHRSAGDLLDHPRPEYLPTPQALDRHRRHNPGEQIDINVPPESLRAQRHHRNLMARQGRRWVRSAYSDAREIFLSWMEDSADPFGDLEIARAVLRDGVGRQPSRDTLLTLLFHPQIIDLAGLLASPEWERRAFATGSTIWLIKQVTLRGILIGYLPKDRQDPLVTWVEQHVSFHKFAAIHGMGLYNVLFPRETIHLPKQYGQPGSDIRASPIHPHWLR